jgi:hypothetical protein
MASSSDAMRVQKKPPCDQSLGGFLLPGGRRRSRTLDGRPVATVVPSVHTAPAMSISELTFYATAAARPPLPLLNTIEARRRGAGILAATLLLAAAAAVACGGSDPASGRQTDGDTPSRPTSAADTDSERRTVAGHGGGSGAVNASTSAPAAPALRLALVGKQLQLSWDAASGAAHYQLFANADGASGFTRVGSNLAADTTSATLEVAAQRLDWDRARYLLEACNGAGCTPSNPVTTFGIRPPATTAAPGARARFAQPAATGAGTVQAATGSAGAGLRARFDPRR